MAPCFSLICRFKGLICLPWVSPHLSVQMLRVHPRETNGRFYMNHQGAAHPRNLICHANYPNSALQHTGRNLWVFSAVSCALAQQWGQVWWCSWRKWFKKEDACAEHQNVLITRIKETLHFAWCIFLLCSQLSLVVHYMQYVQRGFSGMPTLI